MEEAPRTRPMRPCQHAAPRSSALRYYASVAQDMHSRACGVCMPEAVGARSLRAARERLPSARELAEFTARAVTTDDVRALPPMLKMMLNKRRPGI